MTRKNALFILNNTVMFRVVERSESDLPEDIRRLNERAKRGIYDRFRIAIERGIQSGHFRPVDPSVAAFSLIGLCSWPASWSRLKAGSERRRAGKGVGSTGRDRWWRNYEK